MNIQIEDVVKTQDGGRECFDVALKCQEVHRLHKFGFLIVDEDRQRGRNTVTGKPVLKQDKIDKWTEQLIEGTAYLGQLTWNVRPSDDGDRGIVYDSETKTLTLNAMQAYLPDSRHRHMAIAQAVESVAKGSSFDVSRRVSIRIYNIPGDEEPDVFFAYNQEGEAADEGRSKWLKPQDHSRLAREVVIESPHLGEKNVDTVRDRLSKKSYRLASFGTISRAIEDGWAWNPDELRVPERFEKALHYLLAFWDKLVAVRPELGLQTLSRRQATREKLLSDNALAIAAYMRIAHWMHETNQPLLVLDALGQEMTYTDKDGRKAQYDVFSRTNPLWKDVGVLVPQQTKKGQTLNLRNARQTREAMYKVLKDHIVAKSPASASQAA
jgi:hypothetical protein